MIDRCSCMGYFLEEILGMSYYKCNSEYFWAWGWKNALKKQPQGDVYCIGVYGNELKIDREREDL